MSAGPTTRFISNYNITKIKIILNHFTSLFLVHFIFAYFLNCEINDFVTLDFDFETVEMKIDNMNQYIMKNLFT